MIDAAPAPEIAGAVKQIVEEFHPQRVILFGSRAYGSPTPESDFDLMVVLTPEGPLAEEASRLRAAAAAWRDVELDVHVRTPAQIRVGLREHDFFIRDVMRGITLYEGEGMGMPDEQDEEAPEEPGAGPRLKHATQGWLDVARADAELAVRLLGDQFPYTNHICFLAQQGVEKSLKALLQEREIEFPRTHDLVALAKLAAHTAALEKLNDCAVEARYPHRTVGRSEAEAAVRTMEAVRELILVALGVAPPGDDRGEDEAG